MCFEMPYSGMLLGIGSFIYEGVRVGSRRGFWHVFVAWEQCFPHQFKLSSFDFALFVPIRIFKCLIGRPEFIAKCFIYGFGF